MYIISFANAAAPLCLCAAPVCLCVCLQKNTARIEDMRREIGVAQHTNGTTSGADELQLIELIDEGTYGKVCAALLSHLSTQAVCGRCSTAASVQPVHAHMQSQRLLVTSALGVERCELKA